MKCKYCDSEISDDALFCPNCGSPTENKDIKKEYSFSYGAPSAPGYTPHDSYAYAGTGAAANTISDRILSAVRDPLFLAVCILISASTLAGLKGGLPIMGVLFTIFFWLVYAKGRKGIADAQGLRRISGTVFAEYVIIWVIVGILIIAGIFSSVVINFIIDNDILDQIPYNFTYDMAAGAAPAVFSFASLGMAPGDLGMSPLDGLDMYGYGDLGMLAEASSGVLLAVFIFIAVILAIFNLAGLRPIHRFIKSVYTGGLEGKANIVCQRKAKVWLMVFGIFSGIGAAAAIFSGNFVSLVSKGGDAAAMIISSVLVEKYFGDFKSVR